MSVSIDIDNFTLNDEQLLLAIGEIKSKFSPGPNEFPVLMLQKCASDLLIPLKMLWKEPFCRVSFQGLKKII